MCRGGLRGPHPVRNGRAPCARARSPAGAERVSRRCGSAKARRRKRREKRRQSASERAAVRRGGVRYRTSPDPVFRAQGHTVSGEPSVMRAWPLLPCADPAFPASRLYERIGVIRQAAVRRCPAADPHSSSACAKRSASHRPVRAIALVAQDRMRPRPATMSTDPSADPGGHATSDARIGYRLRHAAWRLAEAGLAHDARPAFDLRARRKSRDARRISGVRVAGGDRTYFTRSTFARVLKPLTARYQALPMMLGLMRTSGLSRRAPTRLASSIWRQTWPLSRV